MRANTGKNTGRAMRGRRDRRHGSEKAHYHKENDHYRVVQRGTLYYAQRLAHEKGLNKGRGVGADHVDRFEDLHRGTDHDTAMQQMGAAVAKAKKQPREEENAKGN